jgi:methionyl-tRNA formyltransferase
MKLVFAGTPEFAATALEGLIKAGHTIALVLTQPDRPAGRGLKAQVSPVKALATRQGLAIAQPASLEAPPIAAKLETLALDAMVVAAYGLIVPKAALAALRLGGINIHASLLPRWRGAAPIQRALLAGDTETGISIMQMDEGLDTGAILLQEAIPIGPDETAQTLSDKLARLGARLIVDGLPALPAPRPQDPAHATYAVKIDRREARLDWRDSALVNERKVRAFNPAPGAFTRLGGTLLKVWRAALAPGAEGVPGTVCEAGAGDIVVACGAGGLSLIEVQRAGGKRLDAAAFLAGSPLPAGTRLDG